MEIAKALGGRLVILLPMAFCIFLLLESQDKGVRLFALIALIILEQIREWLLISSIREVLPPVSSSASQMRIKSLGRGKDNKKQ